MLGWRSMRFRRRASFLWRSVRESARLHSRQRGGSTRPSSRVWPISDFGALVRQKSPENFALMVSLSVLAVNVHRLGCLVRAQERARMRRRRKRAA